MEASDWRPSILELGVVAAQRALPLLEEGRNGGGDFGDGHRFHAAKIDRAFAQETGAAFDLMTNDVMTYKCEGRSLEMWHFSS